MEGFSLFYPINPYQVNQVWGVSRPEVYAQFGFTRHNGMDLALVSGQIISAPIPCIVSKIGWEPKGAGNYIVLRTLKPYAFKDGVVSYVEISFFHNMQNLVTVGQMLQTGEPMVLGDSTGFSTGNHSHMRVRRIDLKNAMWYQIDTNEAQNSIDQSQYFNKKYADTQTVVFHHSFDVNLLLGMEGEEVLALQKALVIDGEFRPENVTGVFGQITEQSVKDFQKKYHIVSSGTPSTTGYGFVGKKTRQQLNVLFS